MEFLLSGDRVLNWTLLVSGRRFEGQLSARTHRCPPPQVFPSEDGGGESSEPSLFPWMKSQTWENSSKAQKIQIPTVIAIGQHVGMNF